MTSSNSPRRSGIVTGAAQGLGRVIALRLARDGYDIAVNALSINSSPLESLAEEIRSKGRKAITVIGDVAREEDVQMLVDRAVAELGELYIMVANAGIGNPWGLVVDTSLDVWNRYISINITGVFLCYRAAARQMLKQGHGGRIIGASSMFGKRGENGAAAYSATKFAVRGLTQALATELAKNGITVNAYAPGFIETPLLWHVDEEINAALGDPDGSWIQAMKNRSPMAKLGTPESIAALVSYIVSDEADFMTGQSISLNGGEFYD